MSERTKLYIEMGYEDYDAYSQSTPSCLEVLEFPTEAAAFEMQTKGYGYVEARYPELVRHFNFFPDTSKAPEGTEEVLYTLIDEMASHYTGDEDEADDIEEGEVELPAVPDPTRALG